MADNRARYVALAAALPGFTARGKKSRYTVINGNMFAFVDPEGRVRVRLGVEEGAAVEAENGTGPVGQYGSVMHGYAPLPHAVLEADVEATGFLADAEALKPK